MFHPFRFLWRLIKFFLYAVIALVLFVALFFISLPNISYLRDHNPKTTAFMKRYINSVEAKGEDGVIDIRWIPYSRISSNLKKAVLISEDDAFFSHRGFDLKQIRESIKRNWRDKKFTRGGSTITQQLVKNLYLAPAKNPLRKIREWIITWQMEKTLTKQRIFELYLNVVEWGPGVYGAESAARYYFGKGCGSLGPSEAAFLAAILPNPVRYGAKRNSKRVAWKTNWILRRMHIPPPTEEQEIPPEAPVPVYEEPPPMENIPNGDLPDGEDVPLYDY
ncbi:MAG: monofunctional biosynthetic peptidoglycan transglycosylase [Deltaproteobacteria bacterium]|nr:monofunctional biosynthetic peptidoglycan transglycosylase [Deltaproteobacteria bacterium]